ncbi:Rhamnogalacturonate lyase family protein [Melia azedarach]|uniref:Rhamnogalacturonate lyase family protein n=1 Tax=Melia azedarach TaxID=155640 RepID=A0ACC1WSX9_MELAZ|nr:Rhamnogalacturonate lyase family protein [Melia azedarach]
MSSSLFLLFFLHWLGLGVSSSSGVHLHIKNNHAVMDNGILQVSVSIPQGFVTGIQYNGVQNLLEVQNKENNRGYWDHNYWTSSENYNSGNGEFDRIESTNYTVIMQTEEQVELSFTRIWDPSLKYNLPPLNVDKRFVMLRGSSGFYSYAIYERFQGWPGLQLFNNRMIIKLSQDKFRYMVISDNRQREMPTLQDREKGRPLAYPEAVLLPSGEVDDKYQYSMDAKNIGVHGWISTDSTVGIWQILPSSESRSFGPFKQFLTSHTGPISINTFHSTHYVGDQFAIKFEQGEPWKKIFGPFFVYVNSLPGKGNRQKLWEDANKQFMTEVKNWPYKFPASKDFLSSDQRGSVSGRLLVEDRYVSPRKMPAKVAYVGLAAPGTVGSWQTECKGYQFWTVANEAGYFSIKNVRIGSYNLYAWVPDFIGDYQYEVVINVSAGSATKIGNIIYNPPRDGPTLWEIGIPDRSAAEFYVPEPNPKYINKLYLNTTERFRQYGLWDRYAELHPNGDLVYTLGVSDYRKDWYFAQNIRKKDINTYEGTTWQIKFRLDNVVNNATYKLRLALATAQAAELQVRVNSPAVPRPLFSSGLIGKENTIARHGIHGLYWLFNVDVPSSVLKKGDNIIFLTQPRKLDAFVGLMYDYIRLEAPPNS